jgi:hypothetical protein
VGGFGTLTNQKYNKEISFPVEVSMFKGEFRIDPQRF